MKINEKAAVRIPTKILIPVATFAIGAVFAGIGVFEYGFWDVEGAKPTKAFFPVVVAVGLMAISVVVLIAGIKAGKKSMVEFRLANWFVPLGLIAVVLASFLVGLVPAILIFVVLWLRCYEKQSWKITLASLAIVAIIVIGCFRLWLGIDFPIGLIGELVVG